MSSAAGAGPVLLGCVLLGCAWIAILGLFFKAHAFAAAKQASGALILRIEHADFPSDLVDKLEHAMREEAKEVLTSARIFPPPALDNDAMRIAAGCADDGPLCLSSIGSMLGAGSVFKVTLSGARKHATLKTVWVDVRSKKSRTTHAELQEMDRESVPEFRWHIAHALGAKQPPLSGKIVLKFPQGVPEQDCAIFLDDGRVLDLAVFTVVSPGTHRVEVRHPDHEPFVWMGLVRPFRETVVPVALPLLRKSLPELSSRPQGSSETAPAARDPARPPFEGSHDSSEARLLYTWIFGAGALVAAGVSTGFWLKFEGIKRDLAADGMDCMSLVAKVDPSVDPRCAAGLRAEGRHHATLGVAIGFGVATVIAFLLEGESWLEPEGSSQVAVQGPRSFLHALHTGTMFIRF